MSRTYFDNHRDVIETHRTYGSGPTWSLLAGIRSDNFIFTLQRVNGGPVMVRAGCRYFTLAEASRHWGKRYWRYFRNKREGARLAKESRALIGMALHRAKCNGFIKKVPRWKV